MREFSGGLVLEDLEVVLCAYVKDSFVYAMEREMLFVSLYYD